AMLRAGLEAADPVLAIRGLIGMAELIRFTGLGPLGLLDPAAEVGRAMLAEPEGRAEDDESRRIVGDLLFSIAEVSLDRTEHEAARARYEEALPLFRRAGAVLGEANCIQGLGDIALERTEHEAARARFEEALAR